MLANVEEPRAPSFKYATELFRQAEVKDPGHERYDRNHYASHNQL
jgi:hypothetical protein